MAFHSNYSCDECGSEEGPFYRTIFKRLGENPASPFTEGACFDLCKSCVLDKTRNLTREPGDGLPAVPICKCGATEPLEDSRGEYCSNGHPLPGTEDSLAYSTFMNLAKKAIIGATDRERGDGLPVRMDTLEAKLKNAQSSLLWACETAEDQLGKHPEDPDFDKTLHSIIRDLKQLL